MTRHELINEYFDWMYQLVCENRRRSYERLFSYLHSVDFEYTIPMDGNRAEDGVNLRYRFGSEQGYSDSMIATYLDDRPCSVLEMMIALAIRCEDHIMDDPDVGCRTANWFWIMLINLGLDDMEDRNFDRAYVRERIDIFLKREYERDGKGGLFRVNYNNRDLRSVEIWYQMCWYLDSIIE